MLPSLSCRYSRKRRTPNTALPPTPLPTLASLPTPTRLDSFYQVVKVLTSHCFPPDTHTCRTTHTQHGQEKIPNIMIVIIIIVFIIRLIYIFILTILLSLVRRGTLKEDTKCLICVVVGVIFVV